MQRLAEGTTISAFFVSRLSVAIDFVIVAACDHLLLDQIRIPICLHERKYGKARWR